MMPLLLLALLDFALVWGNTKEELPRPFIPLSSPEEKLQGASQTIVASALLLGMKIEASNPHNTKYFLGCK